MKKKYAVRKNAHAKGVYSHEISPLLQKLLYARGISSEEGIESFLNPSYEKHTHDPYLLKDMDRAVERVLKAISGQEKILIYSDYDADGIPGAVTLSDFFKKIGFNNFEVYIPHRHDEGYGLHLEAVESFVDKKIKLIITIDCGIADSVEVAKAGELGMDVIITDHHEPKEKLPEAYAVLNPKRRDCDYPEKMLCGSGVIFKLIQGILAKDRFGLKEGMEKWFLDMVGLATLSDMVPLCGENRVFAKYGLKVLRKSPRPGLQKLLRILKINQTNLSEDDIGFMITPRINAASRMGHPQDAFNFLSEIDPVLSVASAEHLNKINDERKGVVASIVKEIKKRLDLLGGVTQSLIVMGSLEWRPSLLGLVANTLAEEYKRPVFLWGRDGGDVIKGSCRSDGVTNLVALMEKVRGVFLEFGGHKLAGGFAVSHSHVLTLEEELVRAHETMSSSDSTEEVIEIDHTLDLHEVTHEMWNELEKLSPFGIGNPKPLFLFEHVVPRRVGSFGKQKNHFEMVFEREMDKPLRAIGFFQTPESFSVKPEIGKRMNLVATIEKSFFMNRPEVRLRVVDII